MEAETASAGESLPVDTHVSFGGVMEVLDNGRSKADSLTAEKTADGVLVGYYWKDRFFTLDKLLEFVWEERAAGHQVKVRVNDASTKRGIEKRFRVKAYPDGFLVLGNSRNLDAQPIRPVSTPRLSSA